MSDWCEIILFPIEIAVKVILGVAAVYIVLGIMIALFSLLCTFLGI